MTREDALLAMNGATLIGVADKLGVKVSCNKTRTALKEAKAKVIARILETEAALAVQEAEGEKPEEKEAEAQATQEAEKPEEKEAEAQATQEAEGEKPEAQVTQEAEGEKPEAQATQEAEGEKPEAQEPEAQAVPAPTAEPKAQKAPAATAKKKKAQEPAQEPAEIAAAVTVLDDIFDKLNDLYFDSLLPKAAITIRRITRAYDCCSVKKGEAEGQYTIEVCASAIGKPIEVIAAGILHAMVHLYCMEMGIVETCQKGRYHNSKFKKECEDRDLTVEYDSANGFVHTTPSEIFNENLKATGLDLNTQLAAIPAKKKGAGRA